MQPSHDQFVENLKRARDLASLAGNLSAQTTGALDLSDLFRASLVLAVSALDHFVHELSRKGMLEIAAGTRPSTDAFGRFSISMTTATTLLNGPGVYAALEDEIREKHGYLSFQDPEKIADALRLITAKEVWKEAGKHLRLTNKAAKARLKLIVERRNQIAHEADMDPTAPGVRWPIDFPLVTDAIDALEQIGEALFLVVTKP
ncbi:MAG TPA: HEPN domain-containing protein [Holophagaceae bacterium]|nr:HEPN domain-containing protein [Holophagaceae bacterium]